MKKQGFRIFLIFCFLLPLPCMGWGQPMQMAAGCHCFKDRSYDPARKFAADEYILATSFNSMLATSFNISKKQIIMLRMRMGVGGEDLITSLYLGHLLERDFQKIITHRSSGQSWLQIVSAEEFKGKEENDSVLSIINKNGSDQDVSRSAAAMIARSYFSLPSGIIEKYRDSGFSDKEIVLVLGVSVRSGQPVENVFALNKDKGQSWGEITNSLGIAPGDIDDMIASVSQGGI
jgi:hypothetical protein